MTQPTPNDVRHWIGEAIDCSHLRVEGDGRHFESLIVSASFVGLSTVKRHQLVYRALGERMQSDIHALSMRTLTPDEWRG